MANSLPPSPVGAAKPAALAAVLIGILVLPGCKPAESARSTPPQPVQVMSVQASPSLAGWSYVGVVRPRTETDLGFRVAGKIVERLVDVGQKVEEGQVIARLDPTDYRLAVEAQEAEILAARSNLDQVDATVDIAVASFNDWLPAAHGSLTGRFAVRGAWPALAIAGSADGRSLRLADAQAARLRVDATVASPLEPDGKVQAVASQVMLAGQSFSRVTLDASGNQATHRIAVTADSERFDGSVELAGGLTKSGWRGELAGLEFSAANIASLSLREPSRLVPHLVDDFAQAKIEITAIEFAHVGHSRLAFKCRVVLLSDNHAGARIQSR